MHLIDINLVASRQVLRAAKMSGPKLERVATMLDTQDLQSDANLTTGEFQKPE
ncbi:hypothetical protein [Ruegeria profundi]|uniref:hypothetical protein n=1 Tax=Ruegeria profundi TaxID=1685378 RepID=UPI000AB5C85B|nr:hypothetical protein [Ruegeria profundi]